MEEEGQEMRHLNLLQIIPIFHKSCQDLKKVCNDLLAFPPSSYISCQTVLRTFNYMFTRQVRLLSQTAQA
jgi:hypothetical protein